MPNRKGQYSCDFCRSRKLRCDRPLPCGNCVSRGKTCGFQPVSGQRQRQKQRPQAAQVADATVTTSTSPAPAPAPVTHTPQYTPQPARVEDQQAQGLLADLRSLQKLAEDLERRVIQSTDSNQCDNDHGTPVQLTSGPPPISLDIATTDENQSPSSVEQVGEFVAHLERVSMIPGRQVFTLLEQILLGRHVFSLCSTAYRTKRRISAQGQQDTGYTSKIEIRGAVSGAGALRVAAAASRGKEDCEHVHEQSELHPPHCASSFHAGFCRRGLS